MFDSGNTNILVTGVDSLTNQPGFNVIRSLRAVKDAIIRITAADYNPLGSGLYTNLVDSRYLISYPMWRKKGSYMQLKVTWSKPNPQYLKDVLHIVEVEDINVVIPNLSMEMPIFAVSKEKLEEQGVSILVASKKSVDVVNDKQQTYCFADKNKIDYPSSFFPESQKKLTQTLRKTSFPVVVKSRRHGCCYVNSAKEVKVAYDIYTRLWGEPPIIQEYVPGDQYCVAAVADKGKMIAFVTIRKLGTDWEGASISAVTVHKPRLVEIARRIIRRLEWCGPMEIEWKFDKRDKTYKLMEINSRFPCWIYLSTAAGLNLPWILTQIALGIDVDDDFHYECGMAFVRGAFDYVCPVEDLLVKRREFNLNEQYLSIFRSRPK